MHAVPKAAPVVAPKTTQQVVRRRDPIPRSTVSKGIKAPGRARSDGIQRRLQKTSPWYQSILDPITGADAKIPDDTGVETGTVQLIWKGTVTTNASGFCGMRVKTPYVSRLGNIEMCDPAGGPANISWGWPDPLTPGTFLPGQAVDFDGVADIKAIASHHRIVSAALYVQPECSLADNKGEFVVFTDAFHTMASPLYDDYVNHFKSAIIPVNANQPGIGRWYPIMVDDDSFKAFLECPVTGTYLPPNWNIGFIANGCAASVGFRVTVAVNYEFMPRYNTINVLDTSPSPQDSQEIDLVENWVQSMDVATVTTNKVVSSAPKTVTPNHGENDGDTGFGMMFNVIKEVLPFAAMLL